MEFEYSEPKKEIPTQEKIEFSFDSEESFVRLEQWLKKFLDNEGAEQLVFVLQSMAEESFLNQCQDATQELGKRLAEQFGGEESFFDLVPGAKYSDARASGSLEKIGRHGLDYHSVGLLEMRSNDGKSFAIILDLTFGAVSGKGSRKSVLAMHSLGNREKSLDTLKNNYGGKWEVDYEYDKKTGKFVFCLGQRRKR